MGSPFIEGYSAGQQQQQSSALSKLQQAYLGQQIEGAKQTQATAATNQATAQQLAGFKKLYAGSQAVLNSDDPKGTVEALFPDIVQMHEQQFGAGSWANATNEQILKEASITRDHSAMQLGIAQPKIIGDMSNPEKGIYQQDASGIKQITAPQKPTETSFAPVALADGTVGRFNHKTGTVESTGQKGAARAGGIPAMTDDQMASRAKMIANYEMPPPSSYEMARNPSAAALMEAVQTANPDYSANEFGARSKAFKDFSTGKQGTSVKSFNVAISHLDSLAQAADALDNKDTQLFNKIGNAYARETGNPAPTNFDGMKKIVTDEIVKVIVGAGGGVADREEAAKTLSSASSPAQLIGMMNKYKELMGGQLNGLRLQYEQSTGRKDFQRWLSPRAQSYLASHAQADESPSAQQQAPALQPGQVYKHASGATVEIFQ